MNLLMLRGGVPRDRNPREIVFEKIEDCDDMWTQLFFRMALGHNAELWYWGGERTHKFSPTFTERWVKSFDSYRSDFNPDLIFCRGGFPQYHPILRGQPSAIKIYYGAGRRYLPQKGFHDYQIILQDSPEQLKGSRKNFPACHSTLFIKPAADNLFKVLPVEKEFDICFPAHGRRKDKGHGFVYKSLPEDLSLLHLGPASPIKKPSNVTSLRVIRPEVPKHFQRCRVGIVASTPEVDSCPRVIPEMLACDIPIVVLDETRLWSEKYITPQTGVRANRDNFWDAVRYVLDNRAQFSPRQYYEEHLSLQKASEFLWNVVREIQNSRTRKD